MGRPTPTTPLDRRYATGWGRTPAQLQADQKNAASSDPHERHSLYPITTMMYSEKQLQNMISATASQLMCGQNVAENTAKLIALQPQMDLQQQQHSQHHGPVNLLYDWH